MENDDYYCSNNKGHKESSGRTGNWYKGEEVSVALSKLKLMKKFMGEEDIELAGRTNGVKGRNYWRKSVPMCTEKGEYSNWNNCHFYMHAIR